MTRTAFISLKIRKKSSKIINTTVFLTILTNIFKSGVMPNLIVWGHLTYHNSVFRPVPHMLSPSKACLNPVPLCMMLLHISRACQRVGDKSWIVLAAAGLWGGLIDTASWNSCKRKKTKQNKTHTQYNQFNTPIKTSLQVYEISKKLGLWTHTISPLPCSSSSSSSNKGSPILPPSVAFPTGTAVAPCSPWFVVFVLVVAPVSAVVSTAKDSFWLGSSQPVQIRWPWKRQEKYQCQKENK